MTKQYIKGFVKGFNEGYNMTLTEIIIAHDEYGMKPKEIIDRCAIALQQIYEHENKND